LPALIALEAIGQPWFNDDHRCDMMSIALVSQLLAEKDSEIFIASGQLIELLGPDELSLEALEPLVVMINTWLQRQPNERVQAAIDILLGKAPAKAHKKSNKKPKHKMQKKTQESVPFTTREPAAEAVHG
jgi:hypothetical protein